MVAPQHLDLDHLKQVPLFEALSGDDLEQVLALAARRSAQADEFLFFEGDPARVFYVLTDGRIKLTQVTPDGHQVILSYINPGEAFGVIAVVSEMEYPVTASAVSYSRLLAWDADTMVRMMEAYPQIAFNTINILARHIRGFLQRIQELSTERVERRIARTLLRLAQQTGKKTEEGILLDLPVTRQDLGELSGTTVYTVSRTLSQWESRGILISRREEIVIIQPHLLVQIAEDLPE
jgi:CRP-like cAMP-binding protein